MTSAASPSTTSIVSGPAIALPDGNIAVEMPDEFWNFAAVSANERFDLIILGDSLLLRPCPYTEDQLQALPFHEHRHGNDEAFHPGSHCGLTKWTCAGCGLSSIVLHEDDFPESWIELRLCRGDGDTIASEVVYSMTCLAPLAMLAPEDLRPSRSAVFPPSSD